jgi:hypothetical protein
MSHRYFAVIFVVVASLFVVFAGLLNEDGVISRFMLKRDRIIVAGYGIFSAATRSA